MSDEDNLPLQLDGAFAVATEDRDQLRDLAVRALTELLGEAPAVDEDGDIVVPVHGFALYVTVAEDGPQLHVWSSIVDGVTHRAAAAAELLDLGEQWPRLRFAVDREHVLVSTLFDADPFAPQHLLNLVEEIHDLTHDLDDDFAAKFGGTLDCDADDVSYAGDCNTGGCGDDCACGDGGHLGDTIPVGEPGR
ncbi:hypothetical protein ACFYVR_20835 [Rhodococcus sp. NPDC003318]|uniref:T3SS (YopN, CesT) and YbjN peptide-binding chaperone 1 n=1 Tax=Rhodococcus sp. NPDC003318 TaxID=3364503 RepID=UPI0036CBFD96